MGDKYHGSFTRPDTDKLDLEQLGLIIERRQEKERNPGYGVTLSPEFIAETQRLVAEMQALIHEEKAAAKANAAQKELDRRMWQARRKKHPNMEAEDGLADMQLESNLKRQVQNLAKTQVIKKIQHLLFDGKEIDNVRKLQDMAAEEAVVRAKNNMGTDGFIAPQEVAVAAAQEVIGSPLGRQLQEKEAAAAAKAAAVKEAAKAKAAEEAAKAKAAEEAAAKVAGGKKRKSKKSKKRKSKKSRKSKKRKSKKRKH